MDHRRQKQNSPITSAVVQQPTLPRTLHTDEANAVAEDLYRVIFEQAGDGIFVADPQGRYCAVNPQGCQMLGYTRHELLRHSLSDLLSPGELAREPLHLDKLPAGQSLLTERYLRRKDGSWLLAEIRAQRLPDGRLLTLVRESSERKAQTHLHTLHLQAIGDMMQSFADVGLDWQATLEYMVQKMVEWLGDACFIHLLTEDKQWLTPAASYAKNEAVLHLLSGINGIATLHVDEAGIQQQVLHSGQPQLLPMLVLHPWRMGVQPITASENQHTQSQSMIVAPVYVEGQVIGTLSLLRSQLDWPAFTKEELYLIQDLINRIALSIRNAQLYQAVQTELAQRRQAEEIVRVSEERFRAQVDVSAQIVWTTDATGQAIEDSPSWRAFTGQRNAAGEIIRWYGITDDIRDLRMAEEALRAEQEKLRKIAATVPGIIYVFRQQHNGTLTPLYLSPGVTVLSGISVEEAMEDMSRIFTAVHPEDLPKIYASIAESAQTLRKQTIEYRMQTPHQREIWLESIAVPEREPDGGVLWYGFITDITDRKHAQEQLHYQANLLQNVTDAIIATDLEFHITSWNQGAETLYGWSADEVMGKYLQNVLRLEFENEEFDQVLDHFWANGYWKGEATHYHKNGTPLNVMSSVSPLKDSVGNVVGSVGVNRDISERKRAEEALRQSEDRFTKAFHANPAALSILRLDDNRIVDVNESFLQLYGYRRDQLIGYRTSTLPIFLSAEEHTGLRQLLDQQGQVRDYETMIRTNSGELLNILFSMEIFELDNEPHILATTFDITAHKQVEERLKLALAVAQMGVWEWEVAADRLFWSPECYTIFGAEQFGNTRKAFATFVPPEDLQYVMAEFDNALANHTVYSHEFRIIRPDGEERWVYNLGQASYDKSGKPMRVTGIVQDTTERRRAEAAQAKLEEQLRQAQKMETVGRLAGGVAHDFNNLLTVILGYCDLMLAKMPTEHPLRSKLEQIQKAGRRATALTGQLLAFSRKQMLSPTVLDLNNLVANLQKMLERLIGEDILLTTKLQPELWSITADPSQLEQVIMNLVVNARDAMPTGGRLTIETANHYREEPYRSEGLANLQNEALTGPCIMLAVTDTGCGMDEQVQTHMFEPFFTTKEPGKGTGLGLATVYGIVKQSGGDIFVYSEVGYGSTFKIYLPANPRVGKPAGTGTMSQLSDRGRETILLVEDEEMVCKLVQVALEDRGYTILEAHDAHEALALAAQSPATIDLLITDVVMPQMSGRELAEHIIQLCPTIKVLFTSGYTDDAVVRHGLLTADVEFLPKPFSASGLAQKVRAVLDKPGVE